LIGFDKKSPTPDSLIRNVEKSRKLFFHKWEHIFRQFFQNIYEQQAAMYNNDSYRG
jgi:hypothetical protein